MAEKQLNVEYIYILGRGHNGSTVFNLLLGNHPDIESVGEFSSGFQRGIEEKCSCGSNFHECKLWSQVLTNLNKNPDWIGVNDYSNMLNYLDQFYRLPQVFTGLFLPEWVYNQYIPMSRLLFKEVTKVSNTTSLVDSSKELSRATFLISNFPEKTRIIYLVRDGRAMIWSFLKRFKMSGHIKIMGKRRKMRAEIFVVLYTILSLVFSQIHTAILKFQHPDKILTVKFENLYNNPAEEFDRIGSFVGKDFSNIAAKIKSGGKFSIGHNIGGNSMRYSKEGTFVFKPDDSWKEQLPSFYIRLYRWLGYIHARPNSYK